MLTVQKTSNIVEADVRNGNNQRRYQGNTAGANKRDAAMAQAKASGRNSGDDLLSQVALANPASIASAVTNCGGASLPNAANTGPLKRKFCTYVPSDPIGIRP